MADIQKAAKLANEALSLLQGLDMADRESDGQEAARCVWDIRAAADRWKTVQPGDAAAVRRARDEIADCRRHLHDCAAKLEDVRTVWAQRYRAEIADRKDDFERLSDTVQQQIPEAYRWKRNFSEVSDAMEALGRLNGELLDLGSAIEQDRLETMPPVDIGHMERTDRDPSLSANRS